jgi:chromosome segregation ATPase
MKEQLEKLQESISDKETELKDLQQEQSEKIDELTDLLNDFEVSYEVNDTYRSIEEAVQERIAEREITYYSNAMEYLTNNDTSLRESLGLADEMGYSPANLNSEILATLLLQRELTDNWDRGNDEVEELIEAINGLQSDIESLQEEINDLNLELDDLEAEEV